MNNHSNQQQNTLQANGSQKIQASSSRVKSVDKVTGSGLSHLQTSKGTKQNFTANPRSPEPLAKGGSEQLQDGVYMKDSMNISTPLHYPSHTQKQQMRINSERVESLNVDDKQIGLQGNNVSKQQNNMGGVSQQQYTLNLDLQNKTQGYNFRAKKKSFDKQKFVVKSQEGPQKPGQVSVSQSLNRGSEQRHSINDNIRNRNGNNNQQYGDMMILPNIQQIPANSGGSNNMSQSQEVHSRLNNVASDNKKGNVGQQNGGSRHKQNSINKSQQVEVGGKLSQFNHQLQQRSINGNLNGVLMQTPEGNPGHIYDNQTNSFYDVNGQLQHSHGQPGQHEFQADIQGRSFAVSNSQGATIINMSMDRGKSIGKMHQTGSRFKAGQGDSNAQEMGQNQYQLHLKDNLHNSSGYQSPDYKNQDINKSKQGGPGKISKYASNVDLKPSQGFSSHLGQAPISTVNSQIINENSLEINNQQLGRGIQGHSQNRSHVIASRQIGKRLVQQSLNGRNELNDLRIGQQQIMPTVKSNRDTSNNQQIKQVIDLQRMQSRQRAQKSQFQTQNGSRDVSNHDVKVASVHNSFSAYRNGLVSYINCLNSDQILQQQIKAEAQWQSNRSQEKNTSSIQGTGPANTASLRHQEQRKRARFHQQHYGGTSQNSINDQEQLILNNRAINDKHQSPNQIDPKQRVDSLDAVSTQATQQQSLKNSRNNQRRLIMHSQGHMNQLNSQVINNGSQNILNNGQVNVNRVSLAKINGQQQQDQSFNNSPPHFQPQFHSQKNNFVSSTRNNNYKNDVNQYIEKLRQSGEGFNDKKKSTNLASQQNRLVRDVNETPIGNSTSQQQSKMKHHHQNLTMDQLDVSEIKDKKKQNIHKTINIMDTGNKGNQQQQKDIRVKYFNQGAQQQNQKRSNNSRADSVDSNRSKQDNNQQYNNNGKFLKQFQTQENRLYIQPPNTHKNQHRQSAGQILKPLKENTGKIHSEQQSTKFNLNPYSDNPNSQFGSLDQNDNQNQGMVDETSKTPMVQRQDHKDQMTAQNGMPEKRNRSYTRGRKSGVRNQQISQTLQSSNQQMMAQGHELGAGSPKQNGTLSRQNQQQQHQQIISQSYLKSKVQSQPDLPTISLPIQVGSVGQGGENEESKKDQGGVVNPVKIQAPVPAVNNRHSELDGENQQRSKSIGKEVSPRKSTGITVGPGAAVGLGMPGLTQPYQLLKYSAISRCGMVLKQIMTTSGDQNGKNQQTKLQQVLTPKINQDSFKVIKSFPEATKPFNWLFGVFDGHGPHGEVMSQYAADAMPVILNNTFKAISLNFMPQIQQMQQEVLRLQQIGGKQINESNGGDDQGQVKGQSSGAQAEIANLNSKIRYLQQQRDEKIEKCLMDAFDDVDTDMRLKFGQGPILPENIKVEKPFEMYENDLVHLSGCTGTTILVQEDYLIVANCGDSPVYIFREEPVSQSGTLQKKQQLQGNKGEEKFVGEQLSVNHKPEMPEERERINKIGGVLDQFESQVTGKKVGPVRVWSKETRQPGLAMSRSLGDNLAKSCGVIATPTVRVVPRNRLRDRAILVCSDGISDQISTQEMSETIQFFYRRSQDTENCCKQLVESATQKWHTKHNMQDDITCIVMFLR